MESCNFPESNLALGIPPELSIEECDPLCVFQGTDNTGKSVIISCWKLTAEDYEQIIKTKRIWLWVMGGGMPPVALTTKNPFTP